MKTHSINYSVQGVRTFLPLFIKIEVPDGASKEEVVALVRESVDMSSPLMKDRTRDDIIVYWK